MTAGTKKGSRGRVEKGRVMTCGMLKSQGCLGGDGILPKAKRNVAEHYKNVNMWEGGIKWRCWKVLEEKWRAWQERGEEAGGAFERDSRGGGSPHVLPSVLGWVQLTMGEPRIHLIQSKRRKKRGKESC